MKKRKLAFLGLISTVAVASTMLTACGNSSKDSNPKVEYVDKILNITGSKITISLEEAAKLDLKSLFSVKYDGTNISVTDEMISGKIEEKEGTYNITLTYNNQIAISEVKVVKNGSSTSTQNQSIQLSSTNDVVEVGTVEEGNYYLEELFTILENGKLVDVTSDMIDDGGFKAEAGTYNVVLTYGQKTITSVVKVVYDYEVSILPNTEALTVSKGTTDYDMSNAFKLYIGSTPVAIDAEIVKGDVDFNRTGKYPIAIEYDRFGEIYKAEAILTVMPDVKVYAVTPNDDNTFVGEGVYKANTMFSYKDVFKAVVDGVELPFIEGNLESNISFESNNLAKTGEYDVKYTVIVLGEEFYTTVHYSIQKYEVTMKSEDVTTSFHKSQLKENDDILKVFNLKINGTSYSSSSDFQFVEKSKENETEIVEGKTKVVYTLENNIEYGVVGSYDVSIHFELEGRTFDKTVTVTIKEDVEIKENSNKTTSVLTGVESFDYKTMFSIKKYNPEGPSWNPYDTITVTDEMIDASNVDLNTPGTYDVICTYEGISYTAKFIVADPIYVGTYTATDDSGKTLEIKKDSVIYKGNNSTLNGTFSVSNDVLTITLQSDVATVYGSIECKYVDGLLTFDWNYSGVSDTECLVFAKDISKWTKREASNITKSGDDEYRISEFTSTEDESVKHVFVMKYVYNSISDEGTTIPTDCEATYYIDPTITGTLFEGKNKITLEGTVVEFTFDEEGNFTTGTGGTTTPVVEAKTYTGNLGEITLDGKGKATSPDITPDYSGISYTLFDNTCVLTWREGSWSAGYQYFAKTIVLNNTDNTYTVDESDDGFKRNYISSDSSDYYFEFLGTGYVKTNNIFAYGTVCASYEKDGLLVTVKKDDITLTLNLCNGENDIKIVDAPEEGLYTSKKVFKVASDIAYGHKLTILADYLEVAEGDSVSPIDLYKIEYMDEDTLKSLPVDEYVDFSAVDYNTPGYYVVTLSYTNDGEIYEATTILHVYPLVYAEYEEVGKYYYDDYYNYAITLNADGTAEYITYNTTKGTWTIDKEGMIHMTFGSDEYTAIYSDNKLFFTYKKYGSLKYVYAFRDSKPQKVYKSDGKNIYVVKNKVGVVEYYYLDNDTPYGQVNVLFEAKELGSGVVVELFNGEGTSLLEAKLDSSSFIYAGPEKGTYTGSGPTLKLDGFGNVALGTETGTYEKYKDFYKIIIASSTEYYTLDLENKTYVIADASAVLAGEVKEYAYEVNEGLECAALDSTLKTVWYKFNATVTGKYTIFSISNPSKNVDNKGYLYDASDKQLAYNDDKGDTLTDKYGGHKYDFGFEIALQEGQTYYIKVEISSAKDSKYEGYNLNIVPPTEGVEKGSYTGDLGNLTLNGFAEANLAGTIGTYEVKDSSKILMNVSNVNYLVTLDLENKTYTYVTADAITGNYVISGEKYLNLDGFGKGEGKFTSYSTKEIIYTYNSDTKTLTINTFKYD